MEFDREMMVRVAVREVRWFDLEPGDMVVIGIAKVASVVGVDRESGLVTVQRHAGTVDSFPQDWFGDTWTKVVG